MRRLSLHLLLMPLLGLLLLLPSSLMAQDQEPLRMAVVNVSKKGGASVKKQFTRLLGKNDNIELVDSTQLVDTMEDYGVNYKILRRGSLRKKFRSRISDLMQGTRIEGLFLVDSFSRGRKVQLVVLGPTGTEVANLRRNSKRGRLKKQDTIDMLRDVFPSLAPEVLANRERLARLENEQATATAPVNDTTLVQEEDPEDAEGSLSTQEEQPDSPLGRTFDFEISPSVGLLVGSRALETSEVTGQDALNHSTPLIGLGLELRSILLALGKNKDSAIGVDAFFSYATFTTSFQDKQSQEKITFPSSFTRMGGQLVYHKLLSESLKVELLAGAQMTNIVIDKNKSYTGNRYIAMRAGAGATYFFGEDSFGRVFGGVLPMLKADTSGGALGTSPFSLGFTAGATVGFYVTDSIFTNLNYAFEVVRPDYPEPTGDADIDDAAEATDVFHIAHITLGLTF